MVPLAMLEDACDSAFIVLPYLEVGLAIGGFLKVMDVALPETCFCVLPDF